MEAREATFPTTPSLPLTTPRLPVPAEHLAGSREGMARLAAMLARATDVALANRHGNPLPAGSTDDVLGSTMAALGPSELPREGLGSEAALDRLIAVMAAHGVDLAHPRAVAHLQPPPLAVAVVADAMASVSNASLDTYDSGPATLAIERWLIGALVRLAGLGARADGVLTPGGSLSNLVGVLLARDSAARQRGVDVRREGVAALSRPRVFCSEVAHFSVHRACAALGLGEQAVITVPTDARRRMIPGALAGLLEGLEPDETPLAIIATAGTTDFGTIDPLHDIAALARAHNVWLHIDAAYGFGAMFSDRLHTKLSGLALADSITLDLHKMGWQPAATSALLVADQAAFSALEREVAYLNPQDDTAAGLDGLLGRSLQTTRRPDAVKVAATFLAYGRRGLGDLVDTCHELARYAEHRIGSEPAFELVSPAELTTVVFRYRGTHDFDPVRLDALNGALRRHLLETGTALIGRTEARLAGDLTGEPRVCIKLTLLNPTTSPAEIDALVDAVLQAGRACEAA